MNIENALKILNLNKEFTAKELKRKYYKYALKYHPDKNKEQNANEQFSKGMEAYLYLKKIKNIKEDEELKLDYISIIEKFILNYIPNTIDKCFNNNIYFNIFNNLSRKTSLDIYNFLYNNKDRLSISEELIDKLHIILKKKTDDNCLIILNPSLNDLLNDNVFKLELNDKVHYIPLWHKQKFIDKTIINCVPDLPDNVEVDYYNDMHVKYKTKLNELLDKNELIINLLNKKFKIPINELKIRKKQTYTIKNKGILKINDFDIFSVEKRGNVIFNIELDF